jgi:outer membrane protein assembly factor BamB
LSALIAAAVPHEDLQPAERPRRLAATASQGNQIPDPAPPYRPTWSLTLPHATRVTLAAGPQNFFVGMDTGPLLAYGVADVQKIWTADLRPALPLAVGEQLLFVATEESVHALEQASGQERWSIPTGPLAAAPVWREGWLFTSGRDGTISAWRASDGASVWRQALGSPAAAQPAIDGERLFVPLADGRLVCLRLDGAVLWTTTLVGVGGPPFAAGERVLLGTSHPTFYSIRQEDGALEWPPHRLIHSTVVGHPVLDARAIWISTLSNKVTALSRRNGAIEWFETLPARPAEQLIVEGGQVIVPLDDGHIMAFSQKERKRMPSPTAPAAPPAGTPPAAQPAAAPALAPQPLAPGSRLAAPLVLTGPAEAPQLLRVTLGADDVHTVTAFQRGLPAQPPAGN